MLDPVIHQPVRLQVMASLQRNRDLTFVALRDLLGVTDGNLHAHGQTLREAGYIEVRRLLGKSGFAVRYRLTPEGAAAFERYAGELQKLLAAVPAAQGSGVPSPRDFARQKTA